MAANISTFSRWSRRVATSWPPMPSSTSFQGQVYTALEALDYTLVIDEEIEVVRPYDLPTNKTNHLFNKGYVSTDPLTRRVQWNSAEHPVSSFPFKTDIPKLCEAGHLVQSKAGLLIVETPAEFLRCFDEVWVATYMFDGAPMRAYLEANHFPINMLTVAKDHRGRHQVVPFGSPEAVASELVVKRELRRLGHRLQRAKEQCRGQQPQRLTPHIHLVQLQGALGATSPDQLGELHR